MKSVAWLVTVLTSALLTPALACSSRNPVDPVVPEPEGVVYEEGLASWYGPGFDGRTTASGEVFDADALTAAHRRLPFGSRVRVINLDNGREVVVRVNDRGPWIEGRVIDVSRAAARALGMVQAGTARVQLVLERSREGESFSKWKALNRSRNRL